MPSELRFYKIRDGMMDDWLAFFHAKVVPLHRKYGIPARIGWVSRETSQFIWERGFTTDEPMEVQIRRYRISEERIRIIGDEAKDYVESYEVLVVEKEHEEPQVTRRSPKARRRKDGTCAGRLHPHIPRMIPGV